MKNVLLRHLNCTYSLLLKYVSMFFSNFSSIKEVLRTVLKSN